jgi:uncharacterized protein (UPF0248 family)
MIHILNLLNKIKWDKRENPDEYSIGYWDNVEGQLKHIKYTDMRFEEGNKFNFQHQTETNGEILISEIPFHRIKQVVKGNNIIWQRQIFLRQCHRCS